MPQCNFKIRIKLRKLVGIGISHQQIIHRGAKYLDFLEEFVECRSLSKIETNVKFYPQRLGLMRGSAKVFDKRLSRNRQIDTKVIEFQSLEPLHLQVRQILHLARHLKPNPRQRRTFLTQIQNHARCGRLVGWKIASQADFQLLPDFRPFGNLHWIGDFQRSAIGFK